MIILPAPPDPLLTIHTRVVPDRNRVSLDGNTGRDGIEHGTDRRFDRGVVYLSCSPRVEHGALPTGSELFVRDPLVIVPVIKSRNMKNDRVVAITDVSTGVESMDQT